MLEKDHAIQVKKCPPPSLRLLQGGVIRAETEPRFEQKIGMDNVQGCRALAPCQVTCRSPGTNRTVPLVLLLIQNLLVNEVRATIAA